MGSSNDDPIPAQLTDASPDFASETGKDPASRGFFGRIFNAFTPNDPAEPGAPSAEASPAAAASLPGLGNLRRLRVDDVAIPKIEIVAVPLDITKDALVAVFREHGFSRVVVFKGTLDQPQGLVLLKDLALLHGFGAGPRFNLKKLMRPLLFAPPSMPSSVLLQKMQRERVHMALVIDEYGGVDGLVTIEDLIETIIGEIEDEHDEDEGALWKEEKPGVFVAQPNAPMDEFEAAIGLRLRTGADDEDIDTLGGLIYLRVGRVPARGEIVPHESGGEFEIIDADPRRIKRLRFRLPGAATGVATGVFKSTPEPAKATASKPFMAQPEAAKPDADA
jgi:magnesium and cobalt transporter